MLVKDIGSCKDCPIYMKICHGNKDVLISHCIEPPCVYLNADDDMEKEVGSIIGKFVPLTKKTPQTTATNNKT